MTTDLTHAAFSKNLASEFSLKDDTLSQNLKLIHVSERKASPPCDEQGMHYEAIFNYLAEA
jgi:hypothetical protein